MAHLLYFLESAPAPKTPADLAALGLSHAFDRAPAARPNTQTGPGGVAGICLGVSADRIGYFGEQQKWTRLPSPQSPAPSPLWCGYWLDSPPTPDELRTPHALRGTPVKLFDDQLWEVPIAIACDEESGAGMTIPRTLAIDDTGQWISGQPKPRYTPLWEAAKTFWDQLHGQVPDEAGEVRLPFASVFDAALTVLATNYRVTRTEVALLGLLDDQGLIARQILEAAIELPTYMRWLKKNRDQLTSAGSGTSVGAAA